MPASWRASYGYLLRHPWQLALALLGIAVGVAVIVAVDLANASARKAFQLSMDAVTGEATHQVIGGPRGVDEQVYVRLRVKHGIRSIAPVVTGSIQVAETDVRLLGVDLFAEREMRTFTRGSITPLAGDSPAAESLFRTLLTEPGAVAMSAATASSLGLEVGDPFELIAGGRTRPAKLIGVFSEETASGLDNLLTTDIATAQHWLGQRGWLTRIDARVDGSNELEILEAALPDNVRLLSAAGRTRNTADLSVAFMTNLTAMSLLALLVGLFLIYNSVSFTVLQRRTLIGVLRALGVTRRQVLAMILAESAVIGLVAGGIGVVMGVLLGEQLLALVSRSINDFYFRVTVTDISVDQVSIVKGMAAGLGAALVAASVPAIEATSYPPRLAMTRSTLEGRARRWLPSVAAVGVVMVVLAMVVLFLSDRSLVAGLSAVFLLILGFALCVPLMVCRLTGVLTPIAARLGGLPARIAVSGIVTSLSRTGVAIVALAVAVSATIGVSVMVDSFRGSVSDWLEQTLQADIYAGVQRGSLDARLIDEFAAIDGIRAFSTSRRVTLEDETGRTRLIAIQMAPGGYAGTQLLDAEPGQVWPQWERGDVVLVSEPYAYRNDVERGDTVDLRTDSGERSFDIAATYQSYDINASALLVSRSTYDRHWADDNVDSIGLYLTDRSQVDKVIAEIEALSRGVQQVRVSSNVRIRELSLAIFDRTFVITDVLYWLAIGVAIVGILGAMLALQLERNRELATLRALGMTPTQVGGMITLQTGFIGLLSGVAAIPLGLVMAYVLIEVINRRAFGWHIEMAVAPGILGSSLLFATIAALIAGLYPSWLAAQSNPAIAMREE